jgi:hypothetical protein
VSPHLCALHPKFLGSREPQTLNPKLSTLTPYTPNSTPQLLTHRHPRLRPGGIAGGGGGARTAPTWRIVPGECRESLALQTAVDMGVSDEVVRRSQALLGQLSGLSLVGGRQPSAKHPINSGNRGGDGVPSRSIATGTKAAATRAAAVAGAAGGPGTFLSESRVEAGTLTARGESSLLAPPLEALRDTLRDVAAGIPAFAEPAGGTVGGGAGGAPDTRRTLDNLVWVSARRQSPQP